MNNHFIQYVVWFCNVWFKKLGLWGLVGLAMIVFSLFFYATSIHQLTVKTNEIILSKALNSDHASLSAPLAKQTSSNTAKDVAEFYDIFPKSAAIPTVLSKINRMAITHDLALNSGDYKLRRINENNLSEHTLTRYEIALPIHGRYPQIRTFIADVLHAAPELALSDVALSRDTARESKLNAELAFVLFVKGENWQP